MLEVFVSLLSTAHTTVICDVIRIMRPRLERTPQGPYRELERLNSSLGKGGIGSIPKIVARHYLHSATRPCLQAELRELVFSMHLRSLAWLVPSGIGERFLTQLFRCNFLVFSMIQNDCCVTLTKLDEALEL